MSLEIFIRQLSYLAGEQPDDFGDAVDNVLRDFRSDDNRYGNITKAAQQSIARGCAASSDTDVAHLERMIDSHLSFKAASGCEPRKKPMEPLRTVVPCVVFVDHHLAGPKDPQTGSLETIRNIRHLTSAQREDVPIGMFCGRTYREGHSTWWSFGPANFDCGRDCVAALALPDETVHLSENCGGIVEVAIPAEAMAEPLYKPTSLDGFGPQTKFKPNLTDDPWGLTAPEPLGPHGSQGPQARRELVSNSFRYTEIEGKTACLTITIFPF